MKYNLIIILFLANLSLTYAQDVIELKNSDKLTGKVIDGKSVREAEGNVHFVQGNINVYCNSATQYIDENRLVLSGNVRIYQDTLTLLTSRGVYYGNDKRAIGEGSVTLKDPNATLTANRGTYFFNDAKADFKGNVKVENKDYIITSNELIYFRNTEDSFAKGNVVVITDSAVIKADFIDFLKRSGITNAYINAQIDSDSTIINADTLKNFSFEKKSNASGNVKIKNLSNNVLLIGNYAENFEVTNYSYISGNASLIQVENFIDSLFIYSDKMEAYRNLPEYYKASGNVEIIRNDFLSKSGYAYYFIETETVALQDKPVLWQNNSQMTGDSIYAELPGKVLQKITVNKIQESPNSSESFLISISDSVNFTDRYNQVAGNKIEILFENEKLKDVNVYNNSKSIYFVYDESGKANGVNRVTGENMNIIFDNDEKVIKIVVDKDPVGLYASENNINEITLQLDGFLLRNDKPVKK
ncbi:MAG TPA: OstA-like protein [Ignavibacteria bacterium]|nr:OstA-like protein [Ignavibacteria bacterium]